MSCFKDFCLMTKFPNYYFFLLEEPDMLTVILNKTAVSVTNFKGFMIQAREAGTDQVIGMFKTM